MLNKMKSSLFNHRRYLIAIALLLINFFLNILAYSNEFFLPDLSGYGAFILLCVMPGAYTNIILTLAIILPVLIEEKDITKKQTPGSLKFHKVLYKNTKKSLFDSIFILIGFLVLFMICLIAFAGEYIMTGEYGLFVDIVYSSSLLYMLIFLFHTYLACFVTNLFCRSVLYLTNSKVHSLFAPFLLYFIHFFVFSSAFL